MDSARDAPSVAADDARTTRPLAVVTPLFRERSNVADWQPLSRELPRRRRGRQWLAGVVIGLSVVLFAVFHSQVSAQRVTERLEAGCLDVDDCRALVHAAEAASDGCWFGCASHGALVSQTRARFRAALELAAHQERQRQDDDYEHLLAERRQSETARAEREHEQRLEELERGHRHELAVIAAETDRLREARAQLQQQRVSYLRHLTREQRLARLSACHEQGTICDELMSALCEAAGSGGERKDLIDTHERHMTGQVLAPRRAPPASSAPATAVNSPGPQQAPL